MPRKADLLFLKLAVKNNLLDEGQARTIVDDLERLERAGRQEKARYLCVERGLIDEKTAKKLKALVKGYLEDKAENSTQGRKIGNYAVEAKLGAGAMGIVYKARHVKLGRPVALKLLLPEFAQDDRYVERFEREARAAAQLNHPNVVQCFDAGQEDDVVYIAMEFVDGKTVKELIDKRGRLDEREAVQITIQVARALEHAARHGLIHRDVKPANIMIAGDGTAKLLDLGLAKKVEREEQSDLTEAGRAIGTPYYMAPEQALDGNIDHRCDIYALGATLYCMLTGEPPYKASTPTGVLSKHVHDPIPSARAKVPGLSSGIDKILSKMLAKKPEQRYQKHATLVADLEAVVSGFMPELKEEAETVVPERSGTKGAGMARRPRGQGSLRGGTESGSRTQGVPAASKPMAYVVGVLIVAAASAIFMNVRTRTPDKQQANANGGRGTRPDFDPKNGSGSSGTGEDPREFPSDDPRSLDKSSVKQFEDLKRSGKTGWDLYALLDNYARTRGTTTGAKMAREEADRMYVLLEEAEVKELNSVGAELDRKAAAGDLLAAYDGYSTLAERFKGERTSRAARERAQGADRQIQDLLQATETAVDKQKVAGREDLAAAAIRQTIKLLRPEKRQPAENRAIELEKSYQVRVKRAEQDLLDSELSQVRALATELRTDVLARKYGDAQAAAKKTLEGLTLEGPKAKATVHAGAMDELAEITALASRGFAKLKGKAVRIDRKKGSAAIEGNVGKTTDAGVTIDISRGASVTVKWDELDEPVLVLFAKRGGEIDEARQLRLVALLKIYRGDDDAPIAVQATKDPALAELAKELGIPDAPIAKNDPPKTGPTGNVKPDSTPGKTDPSTLQPTASGRNEREQFIIDNREKLFPGASLVNYYDNAPEGGYDFQTGKDFSKAPWRIDSGFAVPTPGGSDRIGLQLKSQSGRVTFDIPFAGNVKMKIRFYSWGQVRDRSRLALTIDDQKKKDRYESNFGVILNVGAGHKPRASKPPADDPASKLSSSTPHVLEITYQDGVVTSKLDDELIGELDGAGIAELKLGIEWEDVSVSLTYAYVHGVPTDDYVKKMTKSK